MTKVPTDGTAPREAEGALKVFAPIAPSPYEVLAARFGNAAGDCVVLDTKGAGEVHLDTREEPDPALLARMNIKDAASARASGWRHHNEAALAAYKAWIAAGNAPSPFVKQPPPEPTADEIEREALRVKLTDEEKAAARARLMAKAR